MKDYEEILIKNLAKNLFTTTEHLWDILINQARIIGFIGILKVALYVFAAVLAFRFIRQNTAQITKFDKDFLAVVWVLWGCYTTVVIIFCVASISDYISEILNPEYWALTHFIPAK